MMKVLQMILTRRAKKSFQIYIYTHTHTKYVWYKQINRISICHSKSPLTATETPAPLLRVAFECGYGYMFLTLRPLTFSSFEGFCGWLMIRCIERKWGEWCCWHRLFYYGSVKHTLVAADTFKVSLPKLVRNEKLTDKVMHCRIYLCYSWAFFGNVNELPTLYGWNRPFWEDVDLT